MRIVVAGIPRPGFQIDLGLDKAWVCEAATTALDGAPVALSGNLDLQVTSRRVAVRGSVEAQSPAHCDRCGESTERSIQTEISLSYLPENDSMDAELELRADDLDVGWYRDGEIDLGDVLREALALALPSRTLCSDSAGCDARTEALLERERAAEAPSAFAALRQLQ